MSRIGMGMMRHVIRHVALTLLVIVTPVVLHAQDPVKQGLMWNRTGLPAVFPLQVKSLPPKDYFVMLNDAETGEKALAAYFKGGRFFKVLVPPGTFIVTFAFGFEWQNEKDLFGPSTETFTLSRPLTFEIASFSGKRGHVVDLTDLMPGSLAQAEDIEVGPMMICQTYRLLEPARVPAIPLGPPGQSLLSVDHERRGAPFGLGLVASEQNQRGAKKYQPARYEVRARLC